MFRLRLLWFLLFYVVCSYCGKDFTAPSFHQWRFKKRMPNTPGPNAAINITMADGKDSAIIVETVRCLDCAVVLFKIVVNRIVH